MINKYQRNIYMHFANQVERRNLIYLDFKYEAYKDTRLTTIYINYLSQQSKVNIVSEFKTRLLAFNESKIKK